MAGISGTSLDVAGIVSQLMQVEQRPLIRLEQREAAFQAKLSAYGSLGGAVSTFQTAMNGLINPASLQAMKATVSDAEVISASAGSQALPGNHSIEVSGLAQSQKLVAVGKSDTTSAIGSGTLSFTFGTISGGTLDEVAGSYSGATFAPSGVTSANITIDSSNNTLTGLRDAINAAGAGVLASIVNDGGASPYRLVLTSEKTGAAQSIKVSVTGDAGLVSLLAHDPGIGGTQNLAERVSAQNASFKIDGLSVSKDSNSFSDVIEGVALTLRKTNVGAPAALSLARDHTAVQNLVKGFADAYNALQKTLRSLSGFDPATKSAGVLYADGTTSALGASLRSIMTVSLSGAGSYTTLNQLGLSFQRDGTLKLDPAILLAALDKAPSDVAAALSQAGKTTDSMITYTGASSATKAGTHAVNITQLATRGSSAGSSSANLAITSGVNDVLNVTLDGITASVTLAAGSYASAEALALEVETRINAASAFSTIGAKVMASASAGSITLASLKYGAGSAVAVTGGNGATDLLGSSPTNVSGVNVAGTLGGVAASGNGQTLSGASGSNVEGLQVLVFGGSAGSRGTVSYSRGFAYQLSQIAGMHLDAAGTIANRADGVTASIKEIGRQRDSLSTRLALIEERYRRQYSALDGVLSRMQGTQNYLTQQLDMLSRLTSSSGE